MIDFVKIVQDKEKNKKRNKSEVMIAIKHLIRKSNIREVKFRQGRWTFKTAFSKSDMGILIAKTSKTNWDGKVFKLIYNTSLVMYDLNLLTFILKAVERDYNGK